MTTRYQCVKGGDANITYTAICYNCEFEWNADRRDALATCPKCGAEPSRGLGPHHVIRIDREFSGVGVA